MFTGRELIRGTILLGAALVLRMNGAAATAPAAQAIAVEPVWSGHPVGFCLLTHPPFQFVA